jgi:hypothetical protein
MLQCEKLEFIYINWWVPTKEGSHIVNRVMFPQVIHPVLNENIYDV